ncbi:MAG: magnesium/cobalt transporter CorA [Anaerolineae bacterium]|nr:magnesium/cobalt transporter CorA [Anaerolineae bacterium]
MLRILYRQPDGVLRSDLTAADLPALLHEPGGVLWLDLVEEPLENCAHIMRDVFAFHPLAVDDALEETHTPKVDDWESYLYMVLHAVALNQAKNEELETLELDCFLGSNYLVTYQSHAIAAITRVWEFAQRDARLLQRGAANMLYGLSDALATDYMKVIEMLDEQLDLVEDRVFANPDNTLLEQIFTLKRTTLRLRRILAPQREVFNKLARNDYATIPEHQGIYFRDVYDHLVRLYDISDSMRDLVGGALDTYLSVVNNRMNDVMKTLTLITTLFMPLSFLAGFFGMNFFQPTVLLPGWTNMPAFVLTLAAMVISPLLMYWWMRRRSWA